MSYPNYRYPNSGFNSRNNFTSQGSGGSGGAILSGCGGCGSIVLGLSYLNIIPIIGIFALIGGIITLIGVGIATNNPNKGKPIIITGSVIAGLNLLTCCGANMIKNDFNSSLRNRQFAHYCIKCGTGLSKYTKICPNCATRVIKKKQTQNIDNRRENLQNQNEYEINEANSNSFQISQNDVKNTVKLNQNEEKVKKLKELFSISKRVKIDMAATFIGVEENELKEIIISNKTEFQNVKFQGDYIEVL